MSKIKVAAFSVSLDGFGAGPDQRLENPLGVRGGELHTWLITTKMFHRMTGKEGGSEGVDNDFAEKSMENIGAWILGRNMFGPIRGSWPDNEWKGWWGEEPPYHARESLKMKGGTTFHFITGGIESALEEAKKVAKGKDIRIGGGASTIRQFLQAGYINEMHLAFSPIFLGSGEHLFSGIDMSALGFNQVQKINGENATHIIATKS
jgi:dihydrofolate reductase